MMRWQFDEAFLGKLDACDSIRIDWNIWLTGPHVEGRLKLDQKSFCAIHERKQLVFPEVIIGPDYDCGYAWNLNGKCGRSRLESLLRVKPDVNLVIFCNFRTYMKFWT